MIRTRNLRQPLKGPYGSHPQRKRPEENLSIRQDIPLTAEQQLLVVDALEHAAAVVAKYERSYSDLDFLGEVSLRLVRQIRDFDSSQSSLKTWSQCHAHFACRDVLRLNMPSKARAHRRLGKLASLDKVDPKTNGHGRPHTYAEALADDEPSFVDVCQAVEESSRLLRGLSEVEQTAMYAHYVDEVPLKVIADVYAVSESRMSQIRSKAVAFLVEARAADYPEYARRAACR